MYPEKEMAKNQVPYKDQIQSVQSAVNQFKQDNGGILPIKTRDASTPYYQRYPVDFGRLKPYIAEPPGNSFDNGGVFQYVIINEEKDPTVKLFDVRMADKVQDISIRLDMYLQSHKYPPVKEVLNYNAYILDYKKLGYKKAPTVLSPYTQKELQVVMGNDGKLYVDYTPDLQEALNKRKESFKPGEDIRGILAKESMFVPAFSLPYTIEKGTRKIIFMK
ncbi:hypothetical protein [Peribacillus kribbensis]|uniref:hypothetical protein n=1 Tax=Peribacillus kribbensis TaxID=356658 RepID=UPI0006885852|nr:hypothetical protein [Peribacillus kribbensis]